MKIGRRIAGYIQAVRFASVGLVYHVLNRAVARDRLFESQPTIPGAPGFEDVLAEAKATGRARRQLRLLAFRRIGHSV